MTTEIRFFALKSKKEKVLDRGQNGFQCEDSNNNFLYTATRKKRHFFKEEKEKEKEKEKERRGIVIECRRNRFCTLPSYARARDSTTIMQGGGIS